MTVNARRQMDDVAVVRESGYEVNFEQAISLSSTSALPVHNSGGRARVKPDGSLSWIDVRLYDVVPEGNPAVLISSREAATVASSHMLSIHPDWPCLITDVFLYYGFDQPLQGEVTLTRPIFAVDFLMGNTIVVDAVSGEILEIQ